MDFWLARRKERKRDLNEKMWTEWCDSCSNIITKQDSLLLLSFFFFFPFFFLLLPLSPSLRQRLVHEPVTDLHNTMNLGPGSRWGKREGEKRKRQIHKKSYRERERERESGVRRLHWGVRGGGWMKRRKEKIWWMHIKRSKDWLSYRRKWIGMERRRRGRGRRGRRRANGI